MAWGDRNDLRVSDADREATADVLRRAHGEGRLDTTELEERLERCYAAKTYADLDALAADLPRAREPREVRRPRLPLRLAPILLVLIAIAVAAHAWFLWPLLIFAFFRMRHGGRFGHCGRRAPDGHWV